MEKFGKGQKVEEMSIRGAREVRIVTLAFIRMSKRIERFITQRTLMLAGISHDLRTPLTRMKLFLAVKKENNSSPLFDDINEMENMVNSYLSFTRDEVEIEEPVNIIKFFTEQIYNFALKIKIELEDIVLDLRKNSFKRAINNIIKNSNQYAKSMIIKSYSKNNHYIIELHDNGPGVEEKYLEEIFNPFFRVDKSRGSREGNTGLGLAISKDIILSHGGEIKAQKSAILGGLMIKISLPI
jgi:two-component system osmolarity sensor histidine kinase EnvZ